MSRDKALSGKVMRDRASVMTWAMDALTPRNALAILGVPDVKRMKRWSFWQFVDARDGLAVLGFLAVVYGVQQWSEPAAWIIGGLCAIVLAFGPWLHKWNR